MVSSSKILTVSYGTFSCTAEGFDDPLEVVKETTHFFRGVVGEDRFFGAEPPQVDPDLASEYLRDRMADGRGHLSIGSPPRVMAAAASAGAMAAAMSGPAARTQPVDDALPDDDTIDATAILTQTTAHDVADLDPEITLDDVAPAGTEAAPAPPASAPADIADKLERIRAVVSQPPVAEVDVPVVDDRVEELAENDRGPQSALPRDVPDDALDALLNDLTVDGSDLPDTPDPLVDRDTDVHDSALDDAVASLLAEEHKAEDRDAPLDAAPLGIGAAAAATAIAGLSAKALSGNDDDPEPETAEAGTPDIGTDDPMVEAGEAALDRAWSDEQDLPPAAADTDLAQTELAEPPAPQPAQLRARVVKVKKAAFEKAIGDGTLEEVPDQPLSAPPAKAALADNSSLTPEEEEELARELAAVKAELASDFGAWDDDDDNDDISPASRNGGDVAPLRLDNPIALADDDWDDGRDGALETSARKAVKLASPARALLTEKDVEDGDTSRILDQTNSEMDEPEGNRRRSAIAHLRAAVAATKADRLMGKKPDAVDEQEPYREDLANVVRPRRPQSVAHSAERPTPADAAPSPLKLVAEQRVAAPEPDTRTAADAEPVRPRRVRRTEPVASADDPQAGSGFAAFAEDAGVKGLPELLEAAAAYMSYVEGRDQFSRPQLMTTLRQAEITDSSREDRLRSFGQLLREGKIRKTSGGRFTAAETISFKPAATG